MKNSIYRTILHSSVALAACLIASAPTFAQSPLSEKEAATRINAANGLLREGKVDDAIAAYREVVPDHQQKYELNYNLAVAEYRKGNIDSAEQLFNEVAGSGNANISADSRYNLGNCQYAKAITLADKDKPAAVERLRHAISNYRGSLRGNPNNPDARANIELAGELIRKLEEEQKQEEEKKQEQQQDEQNDKNKEDQQQDKQDQSEQQKSEQQQKEDEQKNQQDKSEKSESQQSDSKQGESKEQKSEGDSEQQKSDSQDPKSENKSDEQKKQDKTSNEQNQDQKQKQPQNQKQQSGQQQPEDQGQPEEQEAKNQQIPGGELKAAGEQDENKKPDGSVAMADPNAKDGLMTREEALKMLQAVRDRDMLRRMQQQRQERSRHVSVDRDW